MSVSIATLGLFAPAADIGVPMASKVSITNRALAAIRIASINSLDEDSDPARKADIFFDDSLDYLLTLHPWNFATFRATLARLSTEPDWGWTYEFNLPTNPYCLKVEKVEEDIDYAIEGRKLLSNEQTVKIKYLGRISDPNKLPSPFRECLSYYLASLFAGSIVGSAQLQTNMERKFLWAFSKAKTRDSLEGTAQKRAQGSWVEARINRRNRSRLTVLP